MLTIRRYNLAIHLRLTAVRRRQGMIVKVNGYIRIL